MRKILTFLIASVISISAFAVEESFGEVLTNSTEVVYSDAKAVIDTVYHDSKAVVQTLRMEH